jgi:transcription antitermination factor NusG
MTSAPWFVVQSEPQRETTALDRLTSSGFMAYLPRTKIEHRVAPLFPGYLFVSAVEHWWPIKTTIGVRGLLMAGTAPATVRHQIIATLWHRENPQGIVPTPPRHRMGERLTVLHGPFRDHLAIYLGSAGPDRQRVMLHLLGRMVAMSLPSRDLR